MQRIFIISVLLTTSISAVADNRHSDGYRYPTEVDITLDWEYVKKTNPEPYHIRADFDGNGIEDNAWILVKAEGVGWAAYAFMNTDSGVHEILLTSGSELPAQTMGLKIKEPGTYKTACAKGYGPACRADEPSELVLQNPAIELYQFESSSSMFYWDAATNGYVRVWLSD